MTLTVTPARRPGPRPVPPRPERTVAAPTAAARRAQARIRSGLPVQGRAGRTIVALHGELDIASAPELRTHLLGTLQHSARLLILDLGEVTFCDAAGLAVLVAAGRRATEAGVTLHLANPRPQVTRLLLITGLDRGLLLHPTAPPAVRDVPTPSPPSPSPPMGCAV
ncbi:STAS domain-containing protein [Spirillospora sp. CA-253888]